MIESKLISNPVTSTTPPSPEISMISGLLLYLKQCEVGGDHNFDHNSPPERLYSRISAGGGGQRGLLGHMGIGVQCEGG